MSVKREYETKTYTKTERVMTSEKRYCDICEREITGHHWHILTGHNDWGNDSCETHLNRDLCKECAAKFVADYIMNASGSMELELSVEHAADQETDETGYIPISKKDVK